MLETKKFHKVSQNVCQKHLRSKQIESCLLYSQAIIKFSTEIACITEWQLNYGSQVTQKNLSIFTKILNKEEQPLQSITKIKICSTATNRVQSSATQILISSSNLKLAKQKSPFIFYMLIYKFEQSNFFYFILYLHLVVFRLIYLASGTISKYLEIDFYGSSSSSVFAISILTRFILHSVMLKAFVQLNWRSCLGNILFGMSIMAWTYYFNLNGKIITEAHNKSLWFCKK